MTGLVSMAPWAASLTLASWLLYIAPPARLLPLLEKSRPEVSAIRMQAELRGQTLGEPGLVTLEAHVDFGVRGSSHLGGRWLLQRGRVTVAGATGSGRWVPELEILLIHTPEQFRNWFSTRRIDFERNDLARLGERDCFIIGGLESSAQLWLDKETLEVVRFVSASGVQTDYRAYSNFDRLRLPGVIEVQRGGTPLLLEIESVELAPELGPNDFSRSWLSDR